MSLHWQLSYASGYIELEMFDEAMAEIESISDEDKLKTVVLEVIVKLHTAMKNWGQALPVARTLAKRNPKEIKWWEAWAQATRQTSGYKNASIIYAGASAYHPRSAIIKYHLGCYACLDGRMDEAQKLVREAIELDDNFGLKALDDPDLSELWQYMSVKKGVEIPSKDELLKKVAETVQSKA